jgi:ABC-type phosphate transport system permease subunit
MAGTHWAAVRTLPVCIFRWVVQNTKQHPFLILAGSVYTICFFLLLFKTRVLIAG